MREPITGRVWVVCVFNVEMELFTQRTYQDQDKAKEFIEICKQTTPYCIRMYEVKIERIFEQFTEISTEERESE